ncbi:MAG TPA: 30S ribosomal protein S13 [bacterium]
MPRIVGVDLPRKKRIDVALTYIFGVGSATARKILSQTTIAPEKRSDALSDEEVARLTQLLQQQFKVEGDLRRDISTNIRRLIDIGAYRGLRHKRGLPVRGQQTRTNARTRKGPRPRVGVRKRARVAAASGAR